MGWLPTSLAVPRRFYSITAINSRKQQCRSWVGLVKKPYSTKPVLEWIYIETNLSFPAYFPVLQNAYIQCYSRGHFTVTSLFHELASWYFCR